MVKNYVVILLLAFSISLQASAHTPVTKPVAAPTVCEGILTGSGDQLYQQFFSNYQEHFQDGLATRGFMGAALPNTPEIAEVAMEHGFSYWGARFILVRSREEAVAHAKAAREYWLAHDGELTYRTMEAVYLIGDDSELGSEIVDSAEKQLPVPPEIIKMLIARGGYEVDEIDGEYVATDISPERLGRRLSSTGVIYAKIKDDPKTGSAGRNTLSQGGWVAQKLHGIIDYSVWKHSSKAIRLEKLTAELISRGWKLRFNYNYEGCIEKLKVQPRTKVLEVQDEDGNTVKKRQASDLQWNRYTKDDVAKPALARLKAGKGYSIEWYNPADELEGGEIGFRHGNHFLGDSVFHPGEKYTRKIDGFDGVELAQSAALALMRVLDAQGMPYSDPGMVTTYSKDTGATLIPFLEWLQKIKSGPSHRIEFPETWDPRPTNHLELAFDNIARRRNQGVTNATFVSRLPLDSEAARAAAAAFGIQRGALRFVLVNSLAEAQAHAAQIQDRNDLPFYLVDFMPSSDADMDVVAFLGRALREASDDQLVFIRHPKYVQDVTTVDRKKLAAVLDLSLMAAPPVWNENQIEVPAWSAPKQKQK